MISTLILSIGISSVISTTNLTISKNVINKIGDNPNDNVTAKDKTPMDYYGKNSHINTKNWAYNFLWR